MNNLFSKVGRFKMSFFDGILEIFGFIALISLWVMTYKFQHIGAELVSEDFSFFQTPNEFWASKMTYTVPTIATVLYVGLTVYNLRPQLGDYPVQVSSEKSAQLSEINKRLWRWLKFNLLLIFIVIEYFSFHTGSNAGTGISPAFIYVFPVLLFGPVVFFFIEFSKSQLE
ncbi:hypothetical protein SAMN00777080_0562 [Aquiflexum balticum DSM 16537]|uniref:DUF1648 domain-containing protein n=1 Tax=Aquiflexum balticum DSM 16537 TaxID=758820 RepID=A0A1W2H0J9_9BACT|nr:hypothetical protein [Aquiflexum balticum]SMD42026.1 hypothetical protein SAMN00777080_0562 [Aquiflexum balticum DSM 16537]